MDVLKENVKKLKPAERYCSILFDEMCLSSGLNYNSSVDIIEGLIVDSGTHRNQNFGDHVLVFMVRGIKKKFKQPISYTFCQGATNQYELVRQLKEVIGEIHKTGLTVVATICDQGRPNEDDFYEIEVRRENGNVERLPIVHLFDVPHLMKCTRNNLLTKNLHFVTENTPKVAKWDHLVELYQADSKIEDCKMLPRLTDCHVMPDKIPKMKVRYSTQVFSQRVSAIMSFLASKSVIDPEAAHTAELFLFFDKLFDSLNGSFHKVIEGKIYRTAVTKKSIQHTLWNDSIKVLSTMKFVGKNGKPVKVPTLTNWITTIKGFQTLSKLLDSKGIKSFLPRHCNQDSLESLFGGARSVSCQNPTCSIFISSYKTLLLNNLVSTHSPGSNCEEFTESSLLTYKNLFSFNQENPTQPLCGSNTSRDFDLLKAREYNPSRPSLKYPNTNFRVLVHNIIDLINKCSISHHPNIKSFLVNKIMINFDLNILHCSKHDQNIEEQIAGCIVKLFLNHWCTEINRILSGKIQMRYNDNDPIKQLANIWRSKHSKKKR
ncbi:uncharacterized protein LOC107882746 [Acyrthosiphon pisum]|uniref:Transposable element P transposase n=1 Tax=Acyrthosiphon pisum TaxID=7029 RepID=A0A8R2D1Q0_ACYPI|nr:uncharacterized protein LOC107882746 [Acyrthosiphon pisum]|eukprot:XP_016657074.1 PREDICTED: uncharacterized protein LOC107882746 [Acyrthosiphon pisum]